MNRLIFADGVVCSAEMHQVYKIGTLNFIGTDTRKMFSFVEEAPSAFDSLSITTLGPKFGQRW